MSDNFFEGFLLLLLLLRLKKTSWESWRKTTLWGVWGGGGRGYNPYRWSDPFLSVLLPPYQSRSLSRSEPGEALPFNPSKPRIVSPWRHETSSGPKFGDFNGRGEEGGFLFWKRDSSLASLICGFLRSLTALRSFKGLDDHSDCKLSSFHNAMLTTWLVAGSFPECECRLQHHPNSDRCCFLLSRGRPEVQKHGFKT